MTNAWIEKEHADILLEGTPVRTDTFWKKKKKHTPVRLLVI